MNYPNVHSVLHRLRGVITARSYTNPRLPYLTALKISGIIGEIFAVKGRVPVFNALIRGESLNVAS